MAKKSKTTCNSIFLGKHKYLVSLSKFDSESSQWIHWQETRDHKIYSSDYEHGYGLKNNIFQIDGDLLPLIPQVDSMQFYPETYKSSNLSSQGISVSSLILVLKNGARISCYEFKTASGSTYGNLEVFTPGTHAYGQALNEVTV